MHRFRVQNFCTLLFGFCLGIFVSSILLDIKGAPDPTATEVLLVQNDSIKPTISLYDQVKVACLIFTRPETHMTKAFHVQNTWGKHCNKLIFFTTEDGVNNTIGAVALPVKEGRIWLWHKAKEAFKYVYEHFIDDYDWFFKADDDSYAILDNMRYYLKDYNCNETIAFGYKFNFATRNQTYFAGGSGYVMSKSTMKRFVERGINLLECYPQKDGSEDINVGDCMGMIGVDLIHAVDELNRPYFTPFRPGSMFLYQFEKGAVPEWFFNYSVVPSRMGSDPMPEYPISFHFIANIDLYTYDYLLYNVKRRPANIFISE